MMKKTLLVSLLMTGNLWAASAPPSLEMRWDLKAHSAEGRWDRARAAGLHTKLYFHRSLSSELTARGYLLGEFESGYSGAWEKGEFAPKRSLRVREALLDWRPGKRDLFSLRAGVINQRKIYPPLLVSSSNPFAGFAQKFSKPLGAWRPSLRFQQTVLPDSETYKSPGVLEGGKIPLFFSSALALNYKGKLWSGELSAIHFSFKDLSHKAAKTSKTYGNSIVDSSSGETDSFLYRFAGYAWRGRLKFSPPRSRRSFWAGWEGLENRKAPGKKGQGFRALLGAAAGDTSLELDYLVNRSDSSPGAYTHKSFGHNNRRAHGAFVKVKFPARGYTLVAGVRRLEVLDKTIPAAAYQSGETLIFLGLKGLARWKWP